jgi:hypothetical protein
MMDLEKAGKDSLRFLFHEYLKAPTVVYSLAPITKRYRVDAVTLSDYLLEKGWIRELWVYPDDTAGCRITIKGIEEIYPVYVREKLEQLIGGLEKAGGSRSLLDILEGDIEEYAIAVDFVHQLETLGFVKVYHPKDTIVIELTPEGRKFYERNRRAFLSLMSY